MANVLGVIPARAGSKSIPNKNLYPLAGKPLIAYSIESAKRSKFLTKCIVSTDSEEIARVAKSYGIKVPFLRPKELATDTALAVDVMKHALLEMEKIDKKQYEYLVMLQPTTPLRKPQYIDEAIRKLIDTDCDSVVSMVEVGAHHPARMYRIENDKLISIMDEGTAMRPRQELPSIYIRSGDVYACRRSVIFKHNSLIGDDCCPLVIAPEKAINIDDMKDIVLAEYYLKNSNESA
jgi:CMP-N-acetylneuraminic acid synthetase